MKNDIKDIYKPKRQSFKFDYFVDVTICIGSLPIFFFFSSRSQHTRDRAFYCKNRSIVDMSRDGKGTSR